MKGDTRSLDYGWNELPKLKVRQGLVRLDMGACLVVSY